MSAEEFADRELHPTTMKALRELDAYIMKHNYAPTIRELGELIPLRAISTVTHHLLILEAKRYIEFQRVGGRRQRSARSAKLTESGQRIARSSGHQ